MAQIETWYNQDVTKPVKVQYLDGNVFSMDNSGNKVGVLLFDDGEPVDVAGSISANVIRSDGATIAVSGSSSGNKAWVVLPQAAYVVPGVISIVIKETNGSAITTLCAIVANVYQAETDAVVDPGTIIPSIATLIAAIEAAVASIPADYSSLWTSLAPTYSTSATYSVGQYVTYNGKLYKCTTVISSPESWTSAHWLNVSLGSGVYANETSIQNAANSIAAKYSTEATYAVGQYAMRGGVLYKCTTAISSPESWTPAHWIAVSLGSGVYNNEINVKNAINSVAEPYNSSKTYKVGEMFNYGGKAYRVGAGMPPGGVNYNLIEEAPVGQPVYELSNTLIDITKDGYKQVTYLADSDVSRFTQTYGGTYVCGLNHRFKRGYVTSVSMNRSSAASDNVVAVFITDSTRKIIRKVTGSYPGTSIVVPVNEYIDSEFYVFVRCENLRFGYLDNISRIWYQVAFEDNYGLKEGDTMSGTWRETTAGFVFDIAVNTKSVEKIAEENKITLDTSYRVGEIGQPILNQISLSTLTGTNIICNSFLYPAGYVKSIKMNFTSDNVNPGRVLIILIDENKKVLKKSVVYRQAGGGYQEFKIEYSSRVPFYVACYAPTLAFQTTSANPTLLKYWSGYFETYAYIREGDTLFDTWGNESTPLKFDIVAVYDGQKRIDRIDYSKLPRLYTLQDAFSSWMFGEKFPVVILGDSTTDGSTTTGNTPNEIGTDHQDPNTYTTILQTNLRTALNNNVLRIYNAGFSGRNTEWLIQNLDGILWNNQYYNDAKIAVISMGINDLAMDDLHYGWYKDCLEQLITELYFNGVQPVMMTTQAGTENKTRYGWKQMSLADKLTAETAQKYNLELIDKNKYTALFNVYSNVLISAIIPDGCHYSDAGHKFVAGYLFADLVPFTVWSGEGKTILGFANEQLRTELEFSSYEGYIWKDVKTLSTITNGFKLEADCSKSAETVLMDYWVFVTSKDNKTLTSYCKTPNVQTVIVDGVSTSITQATQTIGALGMGLHHIVVKSGASDNVNYYGLALE